MTDQTICLCMIVKDEAPVISRCLASVRPLIDHWLIVDTGSSDGTQEIVRAAMAGLPGELVELPWVDFAHNRSEALTLARTRAGYSLIIDADDELLLPQGFVRPALHADCYAIDIKDVGIAYRRTQLVSNALPWRYVGVLHEFLTCEGAKAADHLPIVMRRNHDGRRRRDPKTYWNDAAILGRALETEKDPFLVARYTFYLAQSYRDCGEREHALSAYLRRAGLGYWDQEIYVSLLSAGRLMEALGHPVDAVLGVYRAANAACAGRAEAAHAASLVSRRHDRFAEGYAFAKAANGTLPPADGLFVEPWIYDYGLADELAVNAYWSGHYRDCAEACDRLLAEGRMPADMRPRIEANRRFAVEKLGPEDAREPPRAHGAPWEPTRAQGGTEIMVEGLRRRMGASLDRINLCINLYDDAMLDGRPLVVWLHHDVDQRAVQWLDDAAKATRVDCFVFVSDWQRQRYLVRFGLPAERCHVLRNATEVAAEDRPWRARRPWKLAYASTPFRGLSVLLDAWDRLRPSDAELHIWSSHRLYGLGFDDAPYQHLFERARAMPNVTHHGIVPNEELRGALRDCDFLAYPSIFAETSCLTAIEAMAAGCRVICPSHGALPETVGPFGRVYPFIEDVGAHAARFAEILAEEIADPWCGDPSRAVEQQRAARGAFDWSARIPEWQALIDRLVARHGNFDRIVVRRPLGRPEIRKVEAKRGTFYVTAGDFISESVANGGDWEPHLYRLAETVLTESSNVLDLGANFGYHTVGLARLVPKGELFAFEPLNLCFTQVQMNILANCLANVRAYKMAVTDRSGDLVEMDPVPFDDGGRRLNVGITAIGQGGDLASTVRLDDLPLPRIDFIKADIQGAETEALDGMRQLIAKDRPVLFLEIEEAHLRRRGSSSKILIDRLLSLSYTVVRIRTDWPTDHFAIPNERPELVARAVAEVGYEIDLLSGTSVDLTFENDYFYSTYAMHRDTGPANDLSREKPRDE